MPQWDTIAAVREYQVTKDPTALAHAEAAFAYAEGSDAYALGACPHIRYQQPSGAINHLKTLETDANAIKAAILLYQVTGQAAYLQSATSRYDAVRSYFLDGSASLYTVYVFDDGTTCTQVPHRFFASVNGDMIWNGVELSKLTGHQSYVDDAVATGEAVATRLADSAGVFADLQAENDIVEPLVEGMYALATEAGQRFARSWILTQRHRRDLGPGPSTARSGGSSTGRRRERRSPPGRRTVALHSRSPLPRSRRARRCRSAHAGPPPARSNALSARAGGSDSAAQESRY